MGVKGKVEMARNNHGELGALRVWERVKIQSL